MIREPRVYLMDEPLGALDAATRSSARAWIARLQTRTGVTTPYVTHDHDEALALGDRVAVMDGGVLQQVDRPRDLYKRPANTFVAGFVGAQPMNLLPGQYSNGW